MWPRVNGMRAMEIGTPGEMRTRLNALILTGVKRATAGRITDYADDGEEMEAVGERLALVDDEGAAIASIEVTAFEIRRFADVTWEFAQAEGEGFVDITDWREQHKAFWDKFGEPVTDDTEIACIWFEVVDEPTGANGR